MIKNLPTVEPTPEQMHAPEPTAEPQDADAASPGGDGQFEEEEARYHISSYVPFVSYHLNISDACIYVVCVTRRICVVLWCPLVPLLCPLQSRHPAVLDRAAAVHVFLHLLGAAVLWSTCGEGKTEEEEA